MKYALVITLALFMLPLSHRDAVEVLAYAHVGDCGAWMSLPRIERIRVVRRLRALFSIVLAPTDEQSVRLLDRACAAKYALTL